MEVRSLGHRHHRVRSQLQPSACLHKSLSAVQVEEQAPLLWSDPPRGVLCSWEYSSGSSSPLPYLGKPKGAIADGALSTAHGLHFIDAVNDACQHTRIASLYEQLRILYHYWTFRLFSMS